MALTGTDRGSNNNNTAGTSFNLSPASNFTAGTMAVLVVAYDNSGAGGADPFASVSDSHGNTWTSRQRALYDPGNASAGATLAIVTTLQNAGTLTTGSTITVNFGNTTTAKAWVLHQVAAASGFNPVFSNSAAGTGSATGTPTITTASITNGQMVIGGGASESADTWAGDADTTNGSWSTHQHNAAGTGTTGQAVTSQRKVVSATATQTYNPTLTSADCILAWVSLNETQINADGTLSSTIAAVTVSGTGTVAIAGTTSSTISAVTVSGTGTVDVAGTLSATAGSVTVSATGTVESAGISGTLSVTLDAVAVSGSGTVAASGTTSSTLGSVSLSGAGTVDVAGSLSSTVAAVTIAGAGAVDVQGSSSSTLPAVTLAGTGVVSVTGSSSVTLSAVTVSGSGTVLDPGAQGTLDVTLGPIAVSASGQVTVAGSATATLAAIQASATGSVAISGALGSTLAAVAVSADGTVQNSGPILGTLSATLGAMTMAAAAQVYGQGPPPQRTPGALPRASTQARKAWRQCHSTHRRHR